MSTKNFHFRKAQKITKVFWGMPQVFLCILTSTKEFDKQECLSIGCVLPAHQLPELQPPDVSIAGGGTQVNKFEQVSSDGHQMTLAVKSGGVRTAGGSHVMSDGLILGAGKPCTVSSNAFWVLMTWWTPVNRQT